MQTQDLSSDLSRDVKSWACVACICDPRQEKGWGSSGNGEAGRDRQIPGACWPPRIANL